MHNCYKGWFWDSETRTFKRWKDLIGENNVEDN